MYWAAFDVTTDYFIDDVLHVWERMYWPLADPDDRDTMLGEYQIVRLIGDPLYHVRLVTENLDYTKTGCLPNPRKTLTDAKAAVEMLVMMQGA